MNPYPNTITFGIGSRLISAPPEGATAKAWDALRAGYPELDGARVTVIGTDLHVQVERTMGAARDRIALVARIAASFGVAFQAYPSSWSAGTGTVTWAAFSYHGQQVCLETTDCSCHPDVAA